MSTPPDIPRDIEDQLALYFDNQATPQVVQAIQDWLEADPANAQTFAEYGYIERMIFCAQKKEDASAIFAMLAEMEDAAEADLVTLVGELPQQHHKPGIPSGHELVAVGGYVLRKALTSKAAIITGITAAAAILLLALILINPFASDSPDPIADHDFWDDTDTNQPDTPAPTAVAVATLTASHEARWDTPAGTIAPNTSDPLHAGTRLTLTAGFAEITTNRGAVAVLEAPATIELLDNNNALRLHTGKLVGICETESSKGFLVRTPHMDVTDLGTRFGVVVGTDRRATARVFEGSIVVNASSVSASAFKARELVVGQSIRVDARGQETALSEQDQNLFAAFAPRIAGVAQMSGQVDWIDASRFLGVDETDWPKGSRAVLFEEARDHRLQGPLRIDATATPPYHDNHELETGTIIRSYVLLLSPDGSLSKAQGEIVFEGEILGVSTGLRWSATVDTLRAGGVKQPFATNNKATTGIESDFDAVSILPDRRTLTFQLQARSAGDAVRVIVRETRETQP